MEVIFLLKNIFLFKWRNIVKSEINEQRQKFLYYIIFNYQRNQLIIFYKNIF